ncbi:hypothetical protein JMY81_01075 [Brenneria goodwinii]|uniref:hypothetical protein n=1 Tax=Brenneria goodwinii TaxID=1109412 RepID=UPI00065DC14C|nr:hypothetical protein [Brenneria goodwinii]MCG8155187.1 hypothetical protein [Brenneria goodwinii]MCG8159431.1 hypothetical protein [Brenneria goodwinii]MCG8164400.1 hypothetical protein [Brenneria goodwinii]MCG8169034.1 hypothetical protein [Brenneria goodwinii]MCG8173290.1 hypothetical protein [Brenneria goodwinii]
MRITVRDRMSYPIPSQREITPEGYLKVPGRVARVGIQNTDAVTGKRITIQRGHFALVEGDFSNHLFVSLV